MLTNVIPACVMNLITDNFAYSLYPRSTLDENRSLICGNVTGKAESAITKYNDRGWLFLDMFGINQLCQSELPSEFFPISRRIGDAWCWVRKLNPTSNARRPLEMEMKVRWRLKFNKIRMAIEISEGFSTSIDGFKPVISVNRALE